MAHYLADKCIVGRIVQLEELGYMDTNFVLVRAFPACFVGTVNTHNPPWPVNTYHPTWPVNTHHPTRSVNTYHPTWPVNTYPPLQTKLRPNVKSKYSSLYKSWMTKTSIAYIHHQFSAQYA
ncbi:hypothetical protein GDO81_015972 [Engystomops pustulosus]|uniref:Uncharacterized protein n=1 Tax=Engystomops pustulosus TaxID=76066 RepID=A0AAV7AV26_ENGPU|nr:hypothetical protein GDO81_015972 [Engystomops pustulosus]